MEITSVHNPKLKLLKKLKTKKGREQTNLFLLEGIKPLALAFQQKTVLEAVFLEKEQEHNLLPALQELPGIRMDLVYLVPRELLLPLYETDSPQGVLAIAQRKAMDFQQVFKDSMQRILLLDRVQDPGNLGTIIRTAEGAGWDLVLCTKGCADLYNPKTIRSTMGSIMTMNLAQNVNGLDALEILKNKGFQIFCATLQNGVDYRSVEKVKPLVLILGNEGSGIEDPIIKRSDQNLYIPMHGHAESLNVAVAAGILMYHFEDTT